MDIPAIPPRPDPHTGLPRPPHGPLKAGWTPDKSGLDQAKLPAPPQGQTPALEAYKASQRRAIETGALGSIVMFAYGIIRGHGLGWATKGGYAVFLWLVILGMFPVLYFALRAEWVVVGADWMQSGKKWVRLYELTKISLKRSGTNMMLDLTDSAGRNVRVQWSLLQYNRALWDLVYNGILHSVCLGHAETDAGARRHLNLPGNP